MITIVTLGDSITNAAGIGDVTEEDTYRHLLQVGLSKSLGQDVRVINAGVNGDITTQALRRLDRDVLCHRADYVTIMFGVNDAGYFRPNGPPGSTPRVLADDFERNLRTIVERIAAAGSKPVLVTPVPMSRYYWLADLPPYREHGLNYLVDAYADIIRRLAKELNVPLIDVHHVFSSDPETQEFVPDGVHPDKRGQRLIAHLFIEAFSKFLRK